MKKKGKEFKFVKPTHFELRLKHADKEVLSGVLNWLMDSGNHSYSWSYEWDDDMGRQVYILEIGSCWADNLSEISNLLGDRDSE
jgi:hypothetical protein